MCAALAFSFCFLSDDSVPPLADENGYAWLPDQNKRKPSPAPSDGDHTYAVLPLTPGVSGDITLPDETLVPPWGGVADSSPRDAEKLKHSGEAEESKC